ncbi:probable protein-S-isoprenylcysteine O-methyltransferase isoform X2 [Typha angustifolia]|uniref:probable protein-S-isoprenylcysteine O-methyltransferase isoform X2 n=1 Tax=Typha angustifolia TaxID=59011 RepID=UPI003C2DE933
MSGESVINPRSPNAKFASRSTREDIRALLPMLGEKLEEILMDYTAWRQLSQFFAAIVFFHASEYALVVAFHGRPNISFNSLLITKQYVIAMTCALLEYVMEILFFPKLKEYWWVSNVGLAMILIGEILRKSAVITAGRAFTHTIRVYYEDHHDLITHGIYRQVHATSWLFWLLHLGCWNPGYALQSSLCSFFHIGDMEILFYADTYEEYARKVPSGLPFIK